MSMHSFPSSTCMYFCIKVGLETEFVMSQNLYIFNGQLIFLIWLSTLRVVNKISSCTYMPMKHKSKVTFANHFKNHLKLHQVSQAIAVAYRVTDLLQNVIQSHFGRILHRTQETWLKYACALITLACNASYDFNRDDHDHTCI